MWKFFRYWMFLDQDKLKLSKEKSLLVKYSDDLLQDMIKGPISSESFKLKQDADTYVLKYLNCPPEEKTNKITQSVIKEAGLRELMDETIVETHSKSLDKEFKDSFLYPKFKQMLS